MRELREDRRSYFGHLTYHLAVALFFTGCRFHQWARLTFDRLVHEPGGVIIAACLQLKGGSFRDLPLTKELSDSLVERGNTRASRSGCNSKWFKRSGWQPGRLDALQ